MEKQFTPEDFKEGQLLLLDKPLHWTSFQVVSKVRGLIKRSCGIKKIKVGHAGTLDPLATGLLLICTGKFTKKINEFQGMDKEYTGVLELGATTPSYDLESEIDQRFPIEHIDRELMDKVASGFLGEIDQYPPVFSAIKKEGKRLYEYARKGEEVQLDPRKVYIHEFDIVKVEMPKVWFRVKCGKGTYIRSLAHDFGKALNSGAHLTELRRTKIGEYNVTDAFQMEDFVERLPNQDQLYLK